MQCSRCRASDTRVVDSRAAEDGLAIRRRRECAACGHRFTTFERIEDAPVLVRKRSGDRVPFDVSKIVRGVEAACKGRPVSAVSIAAMAAELEDEVRAGRTEMSTEEIGQSVLSWLRARDQVAYLRFASVYKGFANVDDFVAELRLLEGLGADFPARG